MSSHELRVPPAAEMQALRAARQLQTSAAGFAHIVCDTVHGARAAAVRIQGRTEPISIDGNRLCTPLTEVMVEEERKRKRKRRAQYKQASEELQKQARDRGIYLSSPHWFVSKRHREGATLCFTFGGGFH